MSVDKQHYLELKILLLFALSVLGMILVIAGMIAGDIVTFPFGQLWATAVVIGGTILTVFSFAVASGLLQRGYAHTLLLSIGLLEHDDPTLSDLSDGETV